jgi:uracil-DNA glycosylase
MTMPADRRAARELLAFYLEAGVDSALLDAPVDRFAGIDRAAETGAAAPPAAATAAGPAPVAPARPLAAARAAAAPHPAEVPAAPPPPEAAVMAAREAARSATSLEELRAIVAGFEGCALKITAKQLVFADGNPAARVMFVGEAPGREEDLEGLPFVGRSGQLLDRMMAAIKLDRRAAYVANIIPWRPPGNRTPTPQEAAICLPFIRRQIELADPDILVCLGGPAGLALLPVKEGILKFRGRWFDFDTGRRTIRATATLHPAYLLRTPLQKRVAWRDFLAIRAALDAGGGSANGDDVTS